MADMNAPPKSKREPIHDLDGHVVGFVSTPKSKRGGKRPGAGRKPNTQTEDIASLIEALRPVRVGRSGYTRLDRYRDFNRVFFGTAEGRRCLSMIVDLCEGPQLQESDLNNHALLASRAWTRRIGALISAWASVPPPKEIQT